MGEDGVQGNIANYPKYPLIYGFVMKIVMGSSAWA